MSTSLAFLMLQVPYSIAFLCLVMSERHHDHASLYGMAVAPLSVAGAYATCLVHRDAWSRQLLARLICIHVAILVSSVVVMRLHNPGFSYSDGVFVSIMLISDLVLTMKFVADSER